MANKVYEIIADKIISKLDSGTIPWAKPWHDMGSQKNLISKKNYKGINRLLLEMEQFDFNYDSPYWVTYKQAGNLGGNVKKGEKSHMVVFWKMIDRKKDDPKDENEKAKSVPLLRYYLVFNTDQCEGFEDKIPKGKVREHNPLKDCEEVVKNMPDPPKINYNGDKACYLPGKDEVKVPKPEQFNSGEEHYATLFHELVHSTGHEKRLNRKCFKNHGREEYSKEELVAEMGAAFLCGTVQIETKVIDNAAAYIKGWLKSLRNDRTMVVLAASAAQKAADHILNKEV